MANEPQTKVGKAAPPAIDQNTAGWIISLSKLIFVNRKVLLIIFILITALLAAISAIILRVSRTRSHPAVP
jgi:hypothetical protein